jgi:hypothetical protein
MTAEGLSELVVRARARKHHWLGTAAPAAPTGAAMAGAALTAVMAETPIEAQRFRGSADAGTTAGMRARRRGSSWAA